MVAVKGSGSSVPAGVVLAIAGLWVLTQLFGGDALGRLGITGAPTTPGQSGSAPSSAVVPSQVPASPGPAAAPVPFAYPGTGVV
jgi:hypothetical protein